MPFIVSLMRSQLSTYNVYFLVILMLSHLMLQINRFILAIVAQPVAQALHFGDQACMRNKSIEINNVNWTDQDVDSVCRGANNVSDCYDLVTDENGFSLCAYDYFGGGLEYQILVGPVYIFVFTFSGILMGFLADRYNRKNLLALFLALWSIVIVLMAFVTQYWQLLVLRLLLGFTQAGCVPFASSLIADILSASLRGAGIAFFEIGVYFGFSLAFVVGNLVTEADIFGFAWRPAFVVAGAPGVLLALVISATIREPERKTQSLLNADVVGADPDQNLGWKKTSELFCRPFLLVFFLASALRMGAGYCFAYNNQIYFAMIGESATSIARWMSWVPAVSGSIGCLLGGIISDRVAPRLGVVGRIWVVVASLILASPFGSGVLFLSPPYCYLALIGNYILGETFIGVCITIVVELFPVRMRASAVGVYIFVIQNIGGNMEMFIPPLRHLMQTTYQSMSTFKSLQYSLFVMYPGMYWVSAALYIVTILMLACGLSNEFHVNDDRACGDNRIDPLRRSATDIASEIRTTSEQEVQLEDKDDTFSGKGENFNPASN